jgi:hypothetical protein
LRDLNEELGEVRRLGRLLDDGEVGELVDRLGRVMQALLAELARLELVATRIEPCAASGGWPVDAEGA